MNNIFEQLFRYGFHDTKISSVDGEGLEIKLSFNNGIYLLDENGKEANLSNPIQVILRIDSYFDSFEEAFGISMSYYSNFNNCVLFDGGISKKNIMFSIEGVNEIVIQELKK